MRARRWLLLVGSGLAVCVLWLQFNRKPSERLVSESPRVQQSKSTTPQSSGILAQGGCRFSESERLAYRVKRRSVFWINPTAIMDERLNPGLAKIQNDTISEEWTLLMHVDSVREELAVVRLLGVNLGFSQAQSRATLSQLRSQQSIWVEIDRDCRFKRIGSQSNQHPAVLRDWQALLTLIEFVYPQVPKHIWTAVQTDTTGRYEADYSLGGVGKIERVRKHYLSTKSPRPGVRANAEIVDSYAQAVRAKTGSWFDQITVREHVRVNVEGKGKFAQVDTRVSVVGAELPNHPFWSEAFKDELSWVDVEALKSAAETGMRFADDPVDSKLMKLSQEAFLEFFVDLLESDRVGALRALVHWLRHNPSRIEGLIQGMRNREIGSRVHDEIFHAIGLCGGDIARGMLIGAASDAQLSTANRLQALAALKSVPDVHPEAIEYLRELWSERNSPPSVEERAGLLAAGSLSERSATPDELRSEIEDLLRDALESADGYEERSASLGAIGNTRDPKFIDEVGAYLESEDELTRQAALETLNRISGSPDPDEALDYLMSMTTPRGQQYAGEALKTNAKNASDLEVLRAIQLLNQPKTQASQRRGLIIFLGTLSERPEARQGLVQWFDRETDSELLVLIGRFIPGDEL